MKSSNCKQKVEFCNKKRKYDKLRLSGRESETLKRAIIAKEVAREVAFGRADPNQIEALVREKAEGCFELRTKGEIVAKEITSLLSRYFSYQDVSGKKSIPVVPYKTEFCGKSLLVSPDFCFWDKERNFVEVIVLSSGKQTMTNKTGLKDQERTSMLYNVDALGLARYGEQILLDAKITDGTVKVIYDALKNGNDKKGQLVPFKEGKPGKSSYSDNRVGMEFSVKDGKIVLPKESHYEQGLEFWERGISECDEKDCTFCPYLNLCHKGANNDHTQVITKEENKSSVQSFTPEQESILSHSEGVLLVNAGAGSGKTNTIGYRTANLIYEGSDPEKILIISFSLAAVSEMKNRLARVGSVMDIDMSAVRVMTFNQIGRDIISTNWEKLGFSSKPELVTEMEDYQLVIEAAETYGPIEGLDYVNPHLNFGKTKGAIKYLASEFKEIEAFSFSKDGYISSGKKAEVFECYDLYKRLMKQRNLFNHSDEISIIADGIENFYLYSEVENYLGEFEHIVVDEFQDTNDQQMTMLNLAVCGDNLKSLVLVGDYAQSIFGFRGTSPENILNLSERLAGNFKEVFLLENFRSKQNIINAANDVLVASGQAGRKAFSHNKTDFGNFGYFPCGKDDLRQAIESFINSCNLEDLSECAIIAHNGSTLTKVKDILDDLGIKAEIKSKKKILDDRRVKAAIGLCRFYLDNTDTIGLAQYVSITEDGDISENVRNLETLISSKFSLTCPEFLSFLQGKLKDLDKGDDPVYQEFLKEILGKPFSSADELSRYVVNLEDYQLNSSVLTKSSDDSVSLITAHSSKGLEWENVLVITTDFGFTSASDSDYKELMRLLYVAITRAKSNCLCYGTSKLSNIWHDVA